MALFYDKRCFFSALPAFYLCCYSLSGICITLFSAILGDTQGKVIIENKEVK